MWRRIIIFAVLIGSSAFGADLGNMGLEYLGAELNAPVLYNRTLFTQANAGSIIYDSQSGAFYGLPPNVNPATSSNWIQLGGSISTTAVNSSSSSIVERVSVLTTCSSSPCTLTYKTSAVSSITRSGTGTYTINFQSGTFPSGNPPSCTGSMADGTANIVTFNYSGATSTAVDFGIYNGGYADGKFSIICMGN